MPRNIVLIGFMGSGKSTVGRLAAELIGWELVDTDALVVQRTGKSIRDLFAGPGGEAAFRDEESLAVREACLGENRIIATGGGAPLREESTAALRAAGTVVWLTARPEVLVRRSGTGRPLMEAPGEEPLVRVLRLLSERAPHYQRLADLAVDTSDRPPSAVAREIVRRLGLSPS